VYALSSWNYTSLQIVKLLNYRVRKWATCFWQVWCGLIAPSILGLTVYVWRSAIKTFSRTKRARFHCTTILHRMLWKRSQTIKLYSLKPFLHSSICLSLCALKYQRVTSVLFFYSALFYALWYFSCILFLRHIIVLIKRFTLCTVYSSFISLFFLPSVSFFCSINFFISYLISFFFRLPYLFPMFHVQLLYIPIRLFLVVQQFVTQQQMHSAFWKESVLACRLIARQRPRNKNYITAVDKWRLRKQSCLHCNRGPLFIGKSS
jgi:hypothetical protein